MTPQYIFDLKHADEPMTLQGFTQNRLLVASPFFEGHISTNFGMILGSHLSEEKGALGCIIIGDEILPIYTGFIIRHEIRIPSNQPRCHGM